MIDSWRDTLSQLPSRNSQPISRLEQCTNILTGRSGFTRRKPGQSACHLRIEVPGSLSKHEPQKSSRTNQSRVIIFRAPRAIHEDSGDGKRPERDRIVRNHGIGSPRLCHRQLLHSDGYRIPGYRFFLCTIEQWQTQGEADHAENERANEDRVVNAIRISDQIVRNVDDVPDSIDQHMRQNRRPD